MTLKYNIIPVILNSLLNKYSINFLSFISLISFFNISNKKLKASDSFLQ